MFVYSCTYIHVHRCIYDCLCVQLRNVFLDFVICSALYGTEMNNIDEYNFSKFVYVCMNAVCLASVSNVGTVYYEMYGMHACKYLCVSVNYTMYGTEAL